MSARPALHRAESIRVMAGISGTTDSLPCLPLKPTPRSFLIFLCIFSALQTMLSVGLTSASLSSLEVRYSLSSSKSALIPSVADIAATICVAAISHYSDFGHRPRILGIGMFVVGSGAAIFALPQAFSGAYRPSSLGVEPAMCGLPASPTCNGASSQAAYAVLVLGMALIGLGAAPLFTIGPAFLDDNVASSNLHLYIAIFFACAALGPALGFGLSSVFLTSWVDPGSEPAGISPSADSWVGAWWVGYVICAIIAVVAALPLASFPSVLPLEVSKTQASSAINATTIESQTVPVVPAPVSPTTAARSNSSKLVRTASAMLVPAVSPSPPQITLVSLVSSVLQILKCKTFLFIALSTMADSLVLSAYSAFLGKGLQHQYGITASQASLAVGFVIVPGAVAGTFFGGYLLRRFRATGLTAAKIVAVVTVASYLLHFSFLLRCDTPEFAGVTAGYPIDTPKALDSSCNAACGCASIFQPVCGSDGVSYFSPCRAGCTNSTGDAQHPAQYSFSDCSCIANAAGTAGTAKWGACTTTQCSALSGFLLLLFILIFMIFTTNTPTITVVLRCLPEDHRSTGLGVHSTLYRALGTIPGPLIFGSLLDKTCVLWDAECGGRGACLVYSPSQMRSLFFSFIMVARTVTVIGAVGAYFFFRQQVSSGQTADEREEDRTAPKSAAAVATPGDVALETFDGAAHHHMPHGVPLSAAAGVAVNELVDPEMTPSSDVGTVLIPPSHTAAPV